MYNVHISSNTILPSSSLSYYRFIMNIITKLYVQIVKISSFGEYSEKYYTKRLKHSNSVLHKCT